MPTQIPISVFLEDYADDLIFDVINVKVNTEQRLYGKQRRGAGDAQLGYLVVYTVVP